MRLRHKALLVGIGFIVAADLLALAGTLSFRSSKIDTVDIDGTGIILEVADSPAERDLGLGGRESLGRDEGMLFVFEESARRCFWMKDVSFPIDIIWLNENKRVIESRADVRPESYPQTFCSEHPAKYGIELSSGRAAELGWQTGTTLTF